MSNFKTKTFKLEDLEILTKSSLIKLKESMLPCNCPLCGAVLNLSSPMDHQHMTSKEIIGENGAGLVRGLLCNGCNRLLGKIENNSKRFMIENLPEYLRLAADYLEADNLPYIHPNETFRIKEKISKTEYNKIIKLLSEEFNKPKEYFIKKFKYPKNGYITKKLKELKNKFEI